MRNNRVQNIAEFKSSGHSGPAGPAPPSSSPFISLFRVRQGFILSELSPLRHFLEEAPVIEVIVQRDIVANPTIC
jgi:hypothetical protein